MAHIAIIFMCFIFIMILAVIGVLFFVGIIFLSIGIINWSKSKNAKKKLPTAFIIAGAILLILPVSMGIMAGVSVIESVISSFF